MFGKGFDNRNVKEFDIGEIKLEKWIACLQM